MRPPRDSARTTGAVMSEWTTRWGGQGAFCLVYSERNMHCEVYPPRRIQPATGDTT